MPELRPTDDPIAHGTSRGYEAHRRAKQPTCEPCLKAHNADLLDVNRAIGRAKQRLVMIHREDYDRLYAEERGKIRVADDA